MVALPLCQGVFMDAGDLRTCLSAVLPSAAAALQGKELGFTGGNMFPSRSTGTSIPVGAAGLSWELPPADGASEPAELQRGRDPLHGSGLAASGTGFPASHAGA